MSDNRIQSSTPKYTPTTSSVSSNEVSSSSAAPMSKASEAQPDAAAAFFAKDEVVRDEADGKDAFFQTATSAKPRQKADLSQSTAIRDLQAMSVTPKSSMSADGKKQLEALTEKLGNANVFDAETFRAHGQLGTQLNASFFDARSTDKSFYKGLRDMLDNPKETRVALSKALAHLKPSEQKKAVNAIMEKLADKFCERIQQNMSKQVNEALDLSQESIKPFIGADSTARHTLMSMLLHSDMSPREIRTSLEDAGIDPSDSEDIAERIVDIRGNKEQMAAFDKAMITGEMDGTHWESSLFKDGDLRNLEEALQDGFQTMSENLEHVREQLSNDRPRGDAPFVNPLFQSAYISACLDEGIKLDDKSDIAKLLNTRVDNRKTHDENEALLCNTVLLITSSVVPGSGIITGALTGGLAVSNKQMQVRAARGANRAGMVDQSYVDSQVRARNIEAGSAIIGIVGGKVIGKYAEKFPGRSFEVPSPKDFIDWKSAGNMGLDVAAGLAQIKVTNTLNE